MGMDFPGKPLDSARPKTDLKSFPSIQQELKLIAPYSNYNILHFSGLPWSGACSGKKCKISGKKTGPGGFNTMAICGICFILCSPAIPFGGVAVAYLYHSLCFQDSSQQDMKGENNYVYFHF